MPRSRLHASRTPASCSGDVRRAPSPPWSSRSTRPVGRPAAVGLGRGRAASSSSDEATLPPRTRTTGAALSILPGYVYALEQRARVEAARGHLGRCGRPCATGIRGDSAAPVRRASSATSSPGKAIGHEARRQQATVAAIDRLLDRRRGQRRPRVCGLPRRPPRPACGDRRARPAGTSSPAFDLRRRRPRLGLGPCRPL